MKARMLPRDGEKESFEGFGDPMSLRATRPAYFRFAGKQEDAWKDHLHR